MSDEARVLRALLERAQAEVRAQEDAIRLAEAKLPQLRNRAEVLASLLEETSDDAADDLAETSPPVEGAEDDAAHVHHQGSAALGVSITPSVDVDASWASLSMTDAVTRVLTESEWAIGPKAVAERLAAVGLPQDDTDAIRGALAHLKRTGKADTRGRSQWVLLGSRADEAMRASQVVQWDLDGSDDSGDSEPSVNGHRPTEEVRF